MWRALSVWVGSLCQLGNIQPVSFERGTKSDGEGLEIWEEGGMYRALVLATQPHGDCWLGLRKQHLHLYGYFCKYITHNWASSLRTNHGSAKSSDYKYTTTEVDPSQSQLLTQNNFSPPLSTSPVHHPKLRHIS